MKAKTKVKDFKKLAKKSDRIYNLKAELGALDNLLFQTPVDDAIDRMSFLSRREVIKSEIASLNLLDKLPHESTKQEICKEASLEMKKPQVVEELEFLSEVVLCLQKSIDHLEEKLRPILSEKVNQVDTIAVLHNLVPVASGLRNQNNIICNIIEQAKEIVRRIEV